MARIVFTFSKTGKVTIAPEGYGGELCKQVTAAYEHALGGAQTSEPTPEALQPPIAVADETKQVLHEGSY